MASLLTPGDDLVICDIEFGIDDLMGPPQEGEVDEDGDEDMVGEGLARPLSAMHIDDNGVVPQVAPIPRLRSPMQPEPVSDDGF